MFFKDMLGKIDLYKLLLLCAGCFALLAFAAKVSDKVPNSLFTESIVWGSICLFFGIIGLVRALYKKHHAPKPSESEQ